MAAHASRTERLDCVTATVVTAILAHDEHVRWVCHLSGDLIHVCCLINLRLKPFDDEVDLDGSDPDAFTAAGAVRRVHVRTDFGP